MYAVAAHYPDLTVYERQSILELQRVEAQFARLTRLLSRDLAGLN